MISGGYSDIYTIGTSSHDLEDFMALLKRHQITAVVDVRSVPFSRFTPHFNQETIEAALKKVQIAYLFMGSEFGARRDEECCYSGDQVCFSEVYRLPIFLEGVDRLIQGLKKKYRIALMCTEKDPIDCHRTIMVTRYLARFLDLDIQHIHFDGGLESNASFEKRLQEQAGVVADLFVSDLPTLVEMAYEKIERKVAYKREPLCQKSQ